MYLSCLMILIISIILPLIFLIAITDTPIIIGIAILTLSLSFACLFAYTIRSWYAFIIFLIYVGGILIIFSYFISLTPNNRSNYSPKLKLFILTYLASCLTIIYRNSIYVNINYSFNVYYLYKINYFPILLFIILILLFIIVIVIKIISQTKGPIRPFI
jgi:NADH-ubiquinone oxidoreductase chain 6